MAKSTPSLAEWRSPRQETLREYFSGNVARHGVDEWHLHSSLTHLHLLHRGFGYDLSHIPAEDSNRTAVVVYDGLSHAPRPVALVETHPSSVDDLIRMVQASGNTPVRQLERRLLERGLCLGLLTNGNDLHFIDFSIGYEPRASLSLVDLTTLLDAVSTVEQTQSALDRVPQMRDALLILQHGFEASTWRNIVIHLASLSDPHQFHSLSLASDPAQTEFVSVVQAELAALQTMVMAQFALFQSRLREYHRRAGQGSEQYESSLKMERAYQEWRQRVGNGFQHPEQEFCLQTSYIHFVRLLFIRACEDFGLLEQRITTAMSGKFAVCRRELISHVSQIFKQVMAEADEHTTSLYHDLFSRHDLYDWFWMDEQSMVALLAVLNRYDFSQMTLDVLGKGYSEGHIQDLNRSERGQFYTPHQVVQYMVDGMGIPETQAISENEVTRTEWEYLKATAIDLSCGSGSFLCELATRKAAILQRLVARGELQNAEAIEYIVGTLVGIDTNPFACYLAEMNLLIRCMPFLRAPHGDVIIQRLHIYCADALEPTPREIISETVANTLIPNPDAFTLPHEQLTVEEKQVRSIKDTKTIPSHLGHNRAGFDYVVGNPPYVGANESSDQSAYRTRIRSWEIYRGLRDRWDLFVPFIHRSLMFLAPNGVLSLITSSAIETEGYCESARTALYQRHLLRIDFFPKVLLFRNVVVYNTIFTLRNMPIPNPQVVHRVHARPSCEVFTESMRAQTDGATAIFRYAYEAPTTALTTGVIPFCALVYVGAGIEAQSNERRLEQPFTLEDSFRTDLEELSIADRARFVDKGVLGADVQHYHVTHVRHVAYDAMRGEYRRRRFPELFRTAEKLLLGETSGGYYDRDHLFANHSVQVAVPWHLLGGGEDRVRRSSETLSGYRALAEVSRYFDLRYLLAVANSRYMRRHIQHNMMRCTRTRQTRIYPDVWKMIPIKVIPLITQQTIGEMVGALQELYVQHNHYPTGAEVVRQWQQRGLLPAFLQEYVIQSVVSVVGALHETKQAPYQIKEGTKVLLARGQQGLTTLPDHLDVLRYFCLYCNEVFPSIRGKTWGDMQNSVPMPATVAQASELMGEIKRAHQQRENGRKAIFALTERIEIAVVNAYEQGGDVELWNLLSSYRTVSQPGLFEI